MLTVRDAATLLGVSQKTVYRWIKDTRIPCHRVGELYCFERSELFDFAVREHLRPSPDLLQDPAIDEDVPLSEALLRGGIFYRIEGMSKRSVLENALAQVRGVEPTLMAPLVEMFLAREELASTGIGRGVAIPHVRGPLVGYVTAPLLSLSFLETPIDYDTLDGVPVHALFVLISPTVRAHLRLLGQLAFALRDQACMAAVQSRASRETVLGCMRQAEASLHLPNSADEA